MFWIGLIVGMVIGVIGNAVYTICSAIRTCNMSFDEFTEVSEALIKLGNNRESTMVINTNIGTEDEDIDLLSFSK